jgi:ABC-2 type transport system permease protein
MMVVMLRVMALGFWRDRASLILAFVLPPIVFMIFASVFASGASGKLDVRAGVVDEVASADSGRLSDALSRALSGRMRRFHSLPALTAALADGGVDAGVVLAGDLVNDPAPVTVLTHPGRRAAGEVLAAQVRIAATQGVPDLVLRRELARLAPLLGPAPAPAIVLRRLGVGGAAAVLPAPFISQRVMGRGDPLVVYYAGAVSMLFLLFSAAQGAMSLIDERRAGMRMRLGLNIGGVWPLLAGRMLWLTALGVLQALAVFLVAWAVYRVPLWASIAPWLATAVCAAWSAAGVGLCLSAVSRTREQAQTVSTFVILIFAAVGGSMAPRFLMPAGFQAVGWLTPHAWAIEAYQTVVWRGIVDGRVLAAWAVLIAFGAAGLAAALLAEGRRKL